jgi:hypothetical protein
MPSASRTTWACTTAPYGEGLVLSTGSTDERIVPGWPHVRGGARE